MITTNMENQLQYNVHVHGSLKCPGLDLVLTPSFGQPGPGVMPSNATGNIDIHVS